MTSSVPPETASPPATRQHRTKLANADGRTHAQMIKARSHRTPTAASGYQIDQQHHSVSPDAWPPWTRSSHAPGERPFREPTPDIATQRAAVGPGFPTGLVQSRLIPLQPSPSFAFSTSRPSGALVRDPEQAPAPPPAALAWPPDRSPALSTHAFSALVSPPAQATRLEQAFRVSQPVLRPSPAPAPSASHESGASSSGPDSPSSLRNGNLISTVHHDRVQCKVCGCWMKPTNMEAHALEKCRHSEAKKDTKFWFYVEDPENAARSGI
ncbi:hypothetical protein AURDEDRAFT_129873 [Auricularia subglabra TFB-10046 SS5]|nr:hypothetical protein AURDEDRAFT_129873 [Auricularia subglabra TFB-10046 SS5]